MDLIYVKGRRMDRKKRQHEVFLVMIFWRNSLQKCVIHVIWQHYLEYLWDFFSICTVHISLSDRSDMKQLTVGGREMEELL